jgi:hypothetical protein
VHSCAILFLATLSFIVEEGALGSPFWNLLSRAWSCPLALPFQLVAAQTDADAADGIVQAAVAAKHAFSKVVLERLRTVSALQSRIRDFNTRIASLRSFISAHVSSARGCPRAFELCMCARVHLEI